MERSGTWPSRVSRTVWQRLRASWQLNFGPQGTFWDEAFREKTLWEDLRPWVAAVAAQAVGWPTAWWLRSQGIDGYREWAVSIVLIGTAAWTLGELIRRARRHWPRRPAQVERE